MDKITINSSKHESFDFFKNLYSISFPNFEQRTERQQNKAFFSVNYHLIVYKDNDIFVGFISYWEFDDYIYIEHFAVHQELRGKGTGCRILNNFISETPKIILLEIDPVIDNVSEARLRFYQKNGFHENPYRHIHPPYRDGCNGHPLVVLTTKRNITKKEYDTFNNDLTNIVMDF